MANRDERGPLEKLALTSYGDEGQTQYGNIYQRGAVVAGLLDIDATFHQALVEMTFPEIADFLQRYIVDAQSLPIAEYYRKLGIEYDPEGPSFRVVESPTAGQARLRAAWMGDPPKA